MVTCQSGEIGLEVTVELPAYFLSLGRGSVKKHAQKQETSKGVVGRSSCMCSLSIQSISKTKRVGKNTTNSMEWKEAEHFPSKSLWEHHSCACI